MPIFKPASAEELERRKAVVVEKPAAKPAPKAKAKPAKKD